MDRAPANFLGIQQGLPERGIPDVELWNLTESIPGHVCGSTVSRQTLERAGFVVPEVAKEVVKAEVKRHPRGGWTHARPVGSGTTVMIYDGWWPTYAAAVTAVAAEVESFSGASRMASESKGTTGPASVARCGAGSAGEFAEVAG